MPTALAPNPVDRSKQTTLNSITALVSPPLETPITQKSTAKAEQEELLKAFSKDRLKWSNIDWVVAVWMVSMHVGCLAAPFFFSWSAVAVLVVLHWATCSLGICLGYHRYLAHRSMKLAKPVEFAAMALGTISGEGTPLMWSATHRLHHHKSDQPGDPHSPLEGPFWGHLLWLFVYRSKRENEILYRRYVPELLDRPVMRFFERTQGLWMLGTGLLIAGAGYLTAGWFGAVSFLLWGLCVRMVLAYHSTWFVNSATHLWGYRNYKTRDESRNLWWVAILAYGEGWHNNHHAHPAVAPAGHRWYEFDITWWSIKLLRLCGLAYDVNDKLPQTDDAAPVEEEMEQVRNLQPEQQQAA